MALSIALQARLCSNVALNNLTGDVASSGRKVTPRPHRRHPAQDGVLLAEMMGRESFTLLDHLCGRIGRPDTHKEVYVIGLKPPRSKLRGITRKGIVCETPRFLTLFPLQGNLEASSEESPD